MRFVYQPCPALPLPTGRVQGPEPPIDPAAALEESHEQWDDENWDLRYNESRWNASHPLRVYEPLERRVSCAPLDSLE